MPFVKGDPNCYRKGAPKGRSRKIISDIALKELNKKLTLGKQTATSVEWIIRSGISRAIKGDHKWAKFIFGYAYGSPAQMVQISGDGDNPLAVTIADLARLAISKSNDKDDE